MSSGVSCSFNAPRFSSRYYESVVSVSLELEIQTNLRLHSTHLELLCSGNGDDVWALRKQPRESNLACCRVVLGTDALQHIDDFENVWKAFLGESESKMSCKLATKVDIR